MEEFVDLNNEKYKLKAHLINEGALDWMQGALDIVGLVPGVGEAADGLNALISLARDNPLEALLSAISMIPGAGDFIGKGGKLVVKALEPVMDLIKKGSKQGDVLKGIDAGTLESLGEPLKMFKDAIVKYRPQIEKAVEIVKNGDLAAAEEAIGFQLPAVGRGKAEELLKKASSQINVEAIGNAINFFAEINTEQEATPINSSYNPRGYFLLENPTIIHFVMGEEYANKQLKKCANYIRGLK